MSEAQQAADAALTRRGLTGNLEHVGGMYILSGERGTDGALVQFTAEPDEALIEQAADMIVAELARDTFGR
jgi:hypothetical protein